MPVQENKSFVWTHKITLKNADGWLRSEQERIISRIMEIYPCNNFHFIQRYSSHCKENVGNGKIRVWKTANQKAKGLISRCEEALLWSTAIIQPVIAAIARIQPSIMGTANIALGPQIFGNGDIIQPPNKIEGDGRISPVISASALIFPGITCTARIPYQRWSIPLMKGDAKIVYTSEKVVCGNSRIVLGNYPINDAQGNVKIGKLRGCDLKGDLPFTGWRLTRNGSIEHLVWYMRGVKQERWVPKVTQIEIWFNPVAGDTNGEIFRDTIEDLMDYYTFGNRRVDYISDTKFSMKGDYTNQLFKGMKLQINSPDFCCKLFNDQMQELAYFKWMIDNFPYQVALSKINSTNALKVNAKINDDLHEVIVIKSIFNGTNTVVEVSGEAIKDSDCLIMSWRERFDSVEVEKDYYPFSTNARIQAFLRTTGKIFWLVGPPNLPGNEEDYAYKILDVGE